MKFDLNTPHLKKPKTPHVPPPANVDDNMTTLCLKFVVMQIKNYLLQ